MRRSDPRLAVLAAVLAAGCHAAAGSGNAALAAVESEQRAEADDDGTILCAHGGAPFARTCTVERTATDRGLLLTIRRDDGSFRRLLATHDGRGVIAADGAEPARVTLAGPDRIEVALGDDRYQLPATVRPRRQR